MICFSDHKFINNLVWEAVKKFKKILINLTVKSVIGCYISFGCLKMSMLKNESETRLSGFRFQLR